MGFFSSLFGGSNPTLSSAIGTAGQTAAWTSGLGKSLTTQAGNLYSSLLSGDPSTTAKLLAPQIQTQQQQAQQAKKAMSQFGTRSGGTTAAGQTIDDKARANINNLISSLTASAAGGAASMGESLVNTGMNALNQQVAFSQQQLANWSNSILGQGMSKGIGALESWGTSYLTTPGSSSSSSGG